MTRARSHILRMDKALALLACAFIVAGCAGGTKGPSVARVGSPAPNWTEPLAGGGELTLGALRGKAVYLNFFATWCQPCNAEAPYINALQKQYGPRGLQTVGVDEEENAAQALAFQRRFGLVYPAVVDSGKLQDQYEVNGLPVHAFIDRRGIVRRIVVGEMKRSEIEDAIKRIL